MGMGGGNKDLTVLGMLLGILRGRAGSFVVGEEAPGLHGPASSWSMN